MSLLVRCYEALRRKHHNKINEVLGPTLKENIAFKNEINRFIYVGYEKSIIELNNTNEFIPYYLKLLQINKDNIDFTHFVFKNKLENLYPYCSVFQPSLKRLMETGKVESESIYVGEFILSFIIECFVEWNDIPKLSELNLSEERGLKILLEKVAIRDDRNEIIDWIFNISNHRTMIEYICKKGIVNILKYVFDVKGTNVSPNNALIWASIYGKLNCVRYLVEDKEPNNILEASNQANNWGQYHIVKYLEGANGPNFHFNVNGLAFINGAGAYNNQTSAFVPYNFHG